MAPCDYSAVDWIYSMNSNACMAKHRESFTTYTTFESHVSWLLCGGEAKVVGIGSVELEVKMKTAPGAKNSYYPLTLHNVLHVPTLAANIIPGCLEGFSMLGPDSELRNPQSGVTLLLDQPRLLKLWVRGHKKGETSLDPNVHYVLTARWPDGEREKWRSHLMEQIAALGGNDRAHERIHSKIPSEAGTQRTAEPAPNKAGKRSRQRRSKGRKNGEPVSVQVGAAQPDRVHGGEQATARASGTPRYSAEEKAWLKKHFGNEYKFLRAHGLSIYKEKHRREGEQQVRAMMEADARAAAEAEERQRSEDYSDSVSSDPGSADGVLSGNESENEILRPGSNRPYTRPEKKWLRNRYGGERRFLAHHGMDSAVPADREKGRQRARALMEQDGSTDDPWMVDMDQEDWDAIHDFIIYGIRPY